MKTVLSVLAVAALTLTACTKENLPRETAAQLTCGNVIKVNRSASADSGTIEVKFPDGHVETVPVAEAHDWNTTSTYCKNDQQPH